MSIQFVKLGSVLEILGRILHIGIKASPRSRPSAVSRDRPPPAGRCLAGRRGRGWHPGAVAPSLAAEPAPEGPWPLAATAPGRSSVSTDISGSGHSTRRPPPRSQGSFLLVHVDRLEGREGEALVMVMTESLEAPGRRPAEHNPCRRPERPCTALWSRTSHCVGDAKPEVTKLAPSVSEARDNSSPVGGGG